jgi:hypothetical protein
MGSNLPQEPGCAGKNVDTICLDPEVLESGKPIHVGMTNASDFQEIDFAKTIKERISASGRQVASNPKEANCLLQANLLYLREEKKDAFEVLMTFPPSS